MDDSAGKTDQTAGDLNLSLEKMTSQIDALSTELGQILDVVRAQDGKLDSLSAKLDQVLAAVNSADVQAHDDRPFFEIYDELYQSGKPDQARRFAKAELSKTAGNEQLHHSWIRQLGCTKSFQSALDLANLCFVADGDSSALRLNRAYLMYEADFFAEAAGDLEIAKSDPEYTVEAELVLAAAQKKAKLPVTKPQAEAMSAFFNPKDVTFTRETAKRDAVFAALEKHGCAWIKGAFDPKRLGEFDRVIQNNITDIENAYEKIGVDPSFNVGFPLYFASEPSRAKAQQCYVDSYPALFSPDKMRGVDNRPLADFVFESIAEFGLDDIITEYLKLDRIFTSAAACHVRNMVPNGERVYGEFHQDNRLYNSDAEILTLWFPFRYQHGAMPSLEFLPVRSESHFPCVSSCGIGNDLCEPDSFWRPEYQLGDIVLLSGFVPHRTYFEPYHSLERSSVDVRFFASDLPSPIYPGTVTAKAAE